MEMEQQVETPAVTPPVAKVSFTPEQQVKVDSLIRESMGRAGAEAKATATRLDGELATLRAELKAAQGDRSTLEKTQAEIATLRKQNALQEAVSKIPFVDSGQVLQLTENGVVWSDEHRSFVVQGHDGPLLGPDGMKPLPLADYYAAWSEKNPHLVRGSVKHGVGSTENNGVLEQSVIDRTRLKTLFGRGSDSRKANDLGRQNPQEYKRLKADAKRLGLI
jgi:hypothetical protein